MTKFSIQSQLFDAIACVLMTLLASTLTLLWLDLYLSSSSPLTTEQKNNYFYLTSGTLLLITMANFTIHMFLALDSNYSLQERHDGFVLLNIIVAVFVGTILIITSVVITRYMYILQIGNIGKKIAGKTLAISMILGLSLIIKAVFPVVMDIFAWSHNW